MRREESYTEIQRWSVSNRKMSNNIEKEKKKERERERKRKKEREREKESEKEREKARERVREKERERARERKRESRLAGWLRFKRQQKLCLVGKFLPRYNLRSKSGHSIGLVGTKYQAYKSPRSPAYLQPNPHS